MLNKLCAFIRQQNMVSKGDHVICAVSGGADSVALLFGLYLLKDKLGISLSAAHFNHCLRGAESDRDEAFVRELCARYDIPLHVGKGQVAAGEKGLEAAAREARYAYFATLPGKIATAHTADDNAETLLLHLVRGTGLKGLGGITPVRENLIRPMLSVTREEVLSFLEEYHMNHITDSSNHTDDFLRNRLRHHVMPLLYRENPKLAEHWSALALRLRQDEAALAQEAETHVERLRNMPSAHRSRALAAFLEGSGVKEPDAEHIRLAEKLVFSEKPSARASFPGGVTIGRNYDRLERLDKEDTLEPVRLNCPGDTFIPALGLTVRCTPDDSGVFPCGEVFLRSRVSGDEIRLTGGVKRLKKLFIDKKIPAARRSRVPVIADGNGVLWVEGFGANLDRRTGGEGAVHIEIIPENK